MRYPEIFTNKLRVFGKNREIPENTAGVIKNSEAINGMCDHEDAIRHIYAKKLYINEAVFGGIVEEGKIVVFPFAERKQIIFIAEAENNKTKEMFIFPRVKRNKNSSKLFLGIRYEISMIDETLSSQKVTICLIKDSIIIHSREDTERCGDQKVFVEKYKKLNEGKLRPISLATI